MKQKLFALCVLFVSGLAVQAQQPYPEAGARPTPQARPPIAEQQPYADARPRPTPHPPMPEQQPPPNDPIAENLIPPELIMQNQQALGLSEEQKNYLKAELRKSQLRFTELQWQLQDEMEKLAALIKQDKVDESQTLAQLDKLLAIEREIKRAQFSLLIQIKNNLTPEQRSRLQEIKNRPR